VCVSLLRIGNCMIGKASARSALLSLPLLFYSRHICGLSIPRFLRSINSGSSFVYVSRIR